MAQTDAKVSKNEANLKQNEARWSKMKPNEAKSGKMKPTEDKMKPSEARMMKK